MKIAVADRTQQWEMVRDYFTKTNKFLSLTDKEEYFGEYLVNKIEYRRLGAKADKSVVWEIKKTDFLDSIENIISVNDVTYKSIHGLVTTPLYPQCSPFIAILFATKILK